MSKELKKSMKKLLDDTANNCINNNAFKYRLAVMGTKYGLDATGRMYVSLLTTYSEKEQEQIERFAEQNKKF